ncbi:MAG: hypothetical protein O3A20_02705, partial [Planctomycetota bacterium]|nr:hypothetical protein [Planctomycetota bacterium]
MKIALTASLVAVLAAGSLSAQSVAITEHFSAGVPPAGWSQNHVIPGSQGWIQSAVGEAWHEDESIQTDDELISPVLDLSTYTSVYAHFSTRLAYSN